MSTIDRQRVAAVRLLEALGTSPSLLLYCVVPWVRPHAKRSSPGRGCRAGWVQGQ